MRTAARLAVLNCVVLGALIAAPLASADRTHHNTFHLKGANGYRIEVDASPSGGSVLPPGWRGSPTGERGQVTVTVSKRGTSSYYSAPAKVTARRIKARIRGLGWLSVKFDWHRFVPKGRRDKRLSPAAKALQTCTQIEVFKIGMFGGRIHFRGEHGYTWVRAQRAPGSVGWRSPERCRGTSHGTVLSARSGPTRFAAVRDQEFADFAFFDALRNERRRSVLISRLALAIGEQSEFSFGSGLTMAHVAPSQAPFSGSADFLAPDDWTGSLEVSFAGKEKVPLAGPDFTARLKGY
jgi:hypothetical protein